MTKTIRSLMLLALALSVAGAVCFAQSGEATYKAKCAMCHGAAGVPSAGMAKAMGIKPASAPEIRHLSAVQMESTVKNGKGKMRPIKGLSDEQIKAAVEYYRKFQ